MKVVHQALTSDKLNLIRSEHTSIPLRRTLYQTKQREDEDEFQAYNSFRPYSNLYLGFIHSYYRDLLFLYPNSE